MPISLPAARRILVLLALAGAVLLWPAATPPAQARIVNVQGMRMNVPAGYTLTYRSGAYTLANRTRFVKLTFGRTPLAVRPTANQIARGMKGKLSRVRAAKNGTSLSARITRGKRVYELRLRRNGLQTNVQLYGRKASKRRGSNARATDIFGPIVTAGDILALNRVLQSRRGARVIPFNLTVPTRRFQASAQNGASALVPNLPGWQYNGTDTGYLAGGNANQGSFELGGFLLVDLPAFASGARPSGTFTTLDAAVVQILPQYWRQFSSGASTVVMTQVTPVANTAGVLGNGYISSMYEVRMTLNGRPWQGLFTVGATDAVSGISWGLYFSYVAVPVGGPGGIMQALMNTWGTWNNDAAVQAGLQRALNTVLTTRVPGAPIDPAVFAKTHEMWTEYIRE